MACLTARAAQSYTLGEALFLRFFRPLANTLGPHTIGIAINLPESVRTDLRFQIKTETRLMNISEVIYTAIHDADDAES